MQFIFAPIWGRISDRVGRRPILLIGLVGSVVFYALFGYASTLIGRRPRALGAVALLFVARIGAGIAGATIATAQAVIADCTPKEKRAHGMALIGAAFGIGFTFGPLLGWRRPCCSFPTGPEFAGYVGVRAVAARAGPGGHLMPETRRPRRARPAGGTGSTSHGLLLDLADADGRPAGADVLPGDVRVRQVRGDAGAAEQGRSGYSEQTNYWVFAYVGFVLMLTQGCLYRRLVEEVPRGDAHAARRRVHVPRAWSGWRRWLRAGRAELSAAGCRCSSWRSPWRSSGSRS